jgi:hypothetical protein
MNNVFYNILSEFWHILTEMSPYLLFGFLVSGIISTFIPSDLIEKHLGKPGFLSVIKAAFLGIPLLLCSCGVLPIAASLKKNGATDGATSSFLMTTPKTGIDSILISYALLGPIYAIYMPIAALISGILSGVLIDIFGTNKKSIPDSIGNHTNSDDCCSSKRIQNRLLHILKYGFYQIPKEIWKPLLIGLILSGIISALLPADFFAKTIGSGIGTMFILMLASIPLYVCASGSIPVVASLILKGISPGTALVFLMVGPATNITTISVVWKLMGKKTAIIYILSVACTAILAGLTLDYFFEIAIKSDITMGRHLLPHYIHSFSAVILLLILSFQFIYPVYSKLFSKTHNHKEEKESCCCAKTKD